ncbi:MAG: 2-oxoacid:acceptor oxidoreductase family protein, partial [Caulobacteraceae bacterium]|nr:2-oxoacid:acceptor oxidoreductase family protein [Caulobacter sp.]
SVQPIETELGRKRTIDQTACNRDLTCVSGFCPAIVTVKGASPRKAAPATLDGLAALPPRMVPVPLGAKPFSVILAGTGGTGVVTLGAIMGMAAHLEGKGAGVMDMAGLAQKGGIVLTHVKLAENAADISAIRVAAEEADLVLGCDLVAAASRKVVAAIRKNDTALVANVAALYPGEITRRPEYVLPQARLQKQLATAAGATARFLDATKTATTLLGTSLAANMIMLGFAWQSGLVPLAELSIDRAIELNGEAVEMNRRAFALGRRAAAYPEEVAAMVAAALPAARREAPARTLAEIVARRAATLTAYQDAAYAARFEAMVARAEAAERVHAPGSTRLAEAVARSYFKLLAIKDEYEVARLYSDGSFAKQMGETFEGDLAVSYHLAPPVLGRRDAQGRPVKSKLGPWMARLFPLLAKGKHLRGTRFDLFGRSEERRTERAMITGYEAVMDEIFAKLSPENLDGAVAIAALPQKVRGFGHVKEAARLAAKAEEATLLASWRETAPLRLAAE